MPDLETLKENLSDWTDIDFVQHELAIILGIADESKGSFAKEYKWVYWTNNPTGNALHEMLMRLVDIGFLEYDEDEMKVKANPEFDILKDYPNQG